MHSFVKGFLQTLQQALQWVREQGVLKEYAETSTNQKENYGASYGISGGKKMHYRVETTTIVLARKCL